MGMLSYKQYKLLQENLDGVIGISSRPSLGVVSEAPQLVGMMGKMKKMNGDAGMGMGMGKPPMGKPDMDDEDEEDHPHDEEGEEGEDLDKDDADDEEGEEGEDLDKDDLGDEGEEDMGDMGDMGDSGGPMGAGSPPPGMGGPMAGPDMGAGLGGPMGKKKPPMMNKMYMKKMYMKKEAAVDPQDAKMKTQNRRNKANDQDIDKPGTAQKKTTFVREGSDPDDMKKKAQNKRNGAEDQNLNKGGEACCSKCGKMNKKCCKMTKEQQEFNDSLMRQAGALKFTKDELGFWVPVTEDVLIPANNQVQQQTDDEPQAGEVGFAPQQKLGIIGSNFQEWAARHSKAVKKK